MVAFESVVEGIRSTAGVVFAAQPVSCSSFSGGSNDRSNLLLIGYERGCRERAVP